VLSWRREWDSPGSIALPIHLFRVVHNIVSWPRTKVITRLLLLLRLLPNVWRHTGFQDQLIDVELEGVPRFTLILSVSRMLTAPRSTHLRLSCLFGLLPPVVPYNSSVFVASMIVDVLSNVALAQVGVIPDEGVAELLHGVA
jgi:hypothetical protein